MKEITLHELLHSINISEKDTDVLVDGFGEIAICPLIRLSNNAFNDFKNELNAKVIIENNEIPIINNNEEDDEDVWNFLTYLAGYCSVDDYDKWFEQGKII